MSPIAEQQVRVNFDVTSQQGINFFENRSWVDDNTGRHDVDDAGIQNSARDVMQLVRLISDDNRVAGVGSTEKTDDDIELRTQQIDKLAFRLVSPLQSDYTGSWHSLTPLRIDSCSPKPWAKRISLRLNAVTGQ
jgi:hypothetical protein